MKIIIAGSRGFTAKEIIPQVLKYANKEGIYGSELVCGGAKGVDTLAEEFLTGWNWKITKFLPDWEKHGKAAGILRNIQMGDYADALIAIWDGSSKGTKHMIEYMQQLGKPTFVYIYEENKNKN